MSGAQSPQTDRFVHDRLPSANDLPEFLQVAEVPQSGPLNCASFLIDKHLNEASAGAIAIKSGAREWTYEELGENVNRIANVLKGDYGIEPGNRVLIRGHNSPEVAAAWLAIQKIGAVAVTTMSLLRSGELETLINLSEPRLALCYAELAPELETAISQTGTNCPVITFSEGSGQLYRQMSGKSDSCETCRTLADDVSIIAFTSGTTGKPKATVHLHRDILAICKTVGQQIVRPVPDDVFIGTAPLAFTFGLGGLLVFPFFAGAATVLNGPYSPKEFVEAIIHNKASVCFTVPTFYQRMLQLDKAGDLAGLRLAVSSGEALALPVRQLWQQKTGVELAEVMGSTEMLHAFAGAVGRGIKEGFVGPAIDGFKLAVLDDAGKSLPAGEIGRLGVKGPTGCRYLDDSRQNDYVQNGWNITGDACVMDDDGYIAFHTRYDDMIISAGYNISGHEVENALMSNRLISECAVVGEPDNERGQIVAAFVVLVEPTDDLDATARELQDHVRRTIAPYKYPRRIEFVPQLPRNESGKLQRFRLRL